MANKHEEIPEHMKMDDDDIPKSITAEFQQAEIPVAGFTTNTIDVIPVVHLDFDEIKDTMIPDVSGHHNDAHFRRPVDILSFSKSCERGLRLNGGDVSSMVNFLLINQEKK